MDVVVLKVIEEEKEDDKEEDNDFMDFYIEKDGERIEEYDVGDKIILVIETKGKTGKLVDINLNDKEYDFEDQNGQVLENDTIEGYQINSDIEKIPLTVIEQTQN